MTVPEASMTLYGKFMNWQLQEAQYNPSASFNFMEGKEINTDNYSLQIYELAKGEMQTYDTNSNSSIDLNEYINGQAKEIGYRDKEMEEQIASDFDLFDYNNDNNLSQTELAFVHYLSDLMDGILGSYNHNDFDEAYKKLNKGRYNTDDQDYIDDKWQEFSNFNPLEAKYKELATQDAQKYLSKEKNTITTLEYAQKKLENQTFNSEEEKLDAIKHTVGIAAILDTLSTEETVNTIDENSFIRYYRNFDILEDGVQDGSINLKNSQNYENILISALCPESFWNDECRQAEIETLMEQLQ